MAQVPCAFSRLTKKNWELLLVTNSVASMLWNCDPVMRLRVECPAKMYSRRIVLRKQEEEPFDKCTSEYYSCGRKGVHGRKFVPQFSSDSMHIANDPDAGDVHGDSLMLLDTDGCNDDKVQYVSPCGSSCWSQEKGFLDQSLDLGKVNGLCIPQPAEDKQTNFYSATESSPLFDSSVDESESITLGANKTGSNFSASSRNRDCVHDFAAVCEVGFSSQRGRNEEEIKWGVSTPTLSLSPARGGYRRTFPPPLSSVATQSYCDKRGQCPGACSAGSCLRSFRCDGRFVLQEVKASTHKYFRVLRGDGRLKLELVNAENDSSAEEDEASASDVCVGVDNSDSVVEMVTESSCTSKLQAEEGSTYSSMLYAEACIASSQMEKLMSLDSRAGMSTEGCEKTTDLVDKPVINTEKGKPLICVVPEAPSMPETKANASESPSSPRCIEIRALYSGPSPRMKSSWVCPISAF